MGVIPAKLTPPAPKDKEIFRHWILHSIEVSANNSHGSIPSFLSAAFLAESKAKQSKRNRELKWMPEGEVLTRKKFNTHNEKPYQT